MRRDLGHAARDYINRVMMLGATYIAKFDLPTALPEFARRAIVADSVAERALQKTVYEFARRHALTPRETEVVALSSSIGGINLGFGMRGRHRLRAGSSAEAG